MNREKIRRDILSVIDSEIDYKQKFLIQKVKRSLEKQRGISIVNAKDKKKVDEVKKDIDKFYNDDANTIYTTERQSKAEIKKYVENFDKIINLLSSQMDNLKDLVDVIRVKSDLTEKEKAIIFDKTLSEITENDILYQMLKLDRNIKAKKILRERWKQRFYIR